MLLWALASAPTAASAEEVFTAQAAAANATASTWIPAPSNPAAVCIVDTGVDPNPDTTNVIARLSVDNGDPGDVDTIGHHGTLMAMIASAPYNGFGMVGAAPSVKVVSVRAKRLGESQIYFSDVLKGVQMCRQARLAYNIKVISLSMGGNAVFDIGAEALLENTIDIARASNLSVVAAAGNHPGSPDWPAAYPPTFAVAASDGSGARCAFSASGSAVDLLAPGCPDDVSLPDGTSAWASGTSESAAFVSAVLAELRGLALGLDSKGAEELLQASAAPRNAGKVLDVNTALLVGGLSEFLANSSRPDISSSLSAGSTTSTQSAAAQAEPENAKDSPYVVPSRPELSKGIKRFLPRPLLLSRRLRGERLRLILANRPMGARVQIVVSVRQRRTGTSIASKPRLFQSDRVQTRVLGRLSKVSIMYVDSIAKQRSPAASFFWR